MPDNVRQLRGNPGKRKTPPRPRHAPAIPNPPTWVKGEALREWKRITPELHRMGYLAAIDRAALAMYCRWWARWVELDALLNREGLVVDGARRDRSEKVRHPAWSPYHQASEKVIMLTHDLGLTPASRERISATADQDDDDDLD